MNHKVQIYSAFLFLILINILPETIAQKPDFSKVPNLHVKDSANIINLINNGTRVKKGKVIAWFPKDSLSAIQMNHIVDTLNIGIKGSQSLIQAPHAWQVHQEGEPYTFYFRADSFISHASGAGFVSIPFWRIKEGKAPWLHEALHEMLNTSKGSWLDKSIPDSTWASNIPLWLSEGLPDYISKKVSEMYHLSQFDVFSNSSITNIDSVCIQDLKGEKADYILSYIGTKGGMTELFGPDRRFYAPAFYHCSCSFVKYIAEETGIDPLVAALASFPDEIEILEKGIPVSLNLLKKQWLDKLEYR